jgi:hypothetical protein
MNPFYKIARTDRNVKADPGIFRDRPENVKRGVLRFSGKKQNTYKISVLLCIAV